MTTTTAEIATEAPAIVPFPEARRLLGGLGNTKTLDAVTGIELVNAIVALLTQRHGGDHARVRALQDGHNIVVSPAELFAAARRVGGQVPPLRARGYLICPDGRVRATPLPPATVQTLIPA
jgi:hypothetical protein